MAPPRTIEGTAGSRIRLIFGATGSDWLLIIDEDNGDRAWQSHYWSGDIPHKVTTQCNNCTNKGRDVKDVDFGPTGAWYVHGVKSDGSGGHCWWGGSSYSSDIKAETSKPHDGKNQVAFGSDDDYGQETCVMVTGSNGYAFRNVDCDLSRRLKRINGRKKEIKKVRLFSDGAYFVLDDEGTEWKNIGTHCSKALKGFSRGCVEEVAVAVDESWAVLRSDNYVTSTGVDDELKRHLARFYREHKERKAKRNREIQDYQRREQEAREARERAERERREAQEREERERREQEEREERERREQEAREQAERAAREEEEKQVALVTRVSVLEQKLEERLMDEAQSIQEEEELLQKRKRSLLEAIDEMPPERRARIPLASSASGTANSNDNQCVVCHDNRPNMALVPCGHVCLCETCSGALVSRPQDERLCPLCRGGLQSALKIYLPS